MNKLVIFDLGGVLFDIDHTRTIEAFSKLADDPSRILNRDAYGYIADELIDNYERGILTTEEFRKMLLQKYKIIASDDEIDKAWNATLIEPIYENLEFAMEVSLKHDTILLSNTNELHYDCFEPICRDYFKHFKGTHYSHKIGLRKPEYSIYNFIISKYQDQISNAIFIDDNYNNVYAAIEAGIYSVHLTKPMDLSTIINNFLIHN